MNRIHTPVDLACHASIRGLSSSLPYSYTGRLCMYSMITHWVKHTSIKFVFTASVCEDDPTFDCVKLSSVLGICDNIEQAQKTCLKYCNLCPVGKCTVGSNQNINTKLCYIIKKLTFAI